jgi:hypothetical protein
MIDTDKYEGHTEGLWDILVCSTTEKKWIIDGSHCSAWKSIALIEGLDEGVEGLTNMMLIADAPLLLQEVKRLREQNTLLASQVRLAYEWVEAFHNEGTMISFIEHVYGDEEE